MYLLNPSATSRMREEQGKTGLNASPRLVAYQSYITQSALFMERRDGFISFPRALAQSKTQKTSSTIWTGISNFIYSDNNSGNKHAFQNSWMML